MFQIGQARTDRVDERAVSAQEVTQPDTGYTEDLTHTLDDDEIGVL